jgi:hypothetical protein
MAPVLLPPPSATGGGTGVPGFVSTGEASSVVSTGEASSVGVVVSMVEVELDVDVVEVVLKKGSLSRVMILCEAPHMNMDLTVAPGQMFVTHAGRELPWLVDVSGFEASRAQIDGSTHQQPVLGPDPSHADAL